MSSLQSYPDADLPVQAGTPHVPPYSSRAPAWWQALTRPRNLPGFSTIDRITRKFSPAERLLVYLFAAGLIGSVIYMLAVLNQDAMVTQPAPGGELVEGIVGTPRFANPLLATSDADRDLVQLVYSGLLRATADGSFVPDLAATYEISDDGLTYTFVLRDDATFHDGTPVTAADVAFTIHAAQNPDIKSLKRANWEGVSVVEVDERTVSFTLAQPYAPFLENATLGILPQARWQNVSAEEFPFHQLNSHPIGSGPYRITRIDVDDAGTPTRYTLKAFTNFTLGTPYLETIRLRFYPNEDELVSALTRGEVASIAGIASSRVPALTAEGFVARSTPLPRVFAVFFNQNQAPVFLSSAVREALDVALDKDAIVAQVLSGYGAPLSGPLPPGVISTESTSALAALSEDAAENETADDEPEAAAVVAETSTIDRLAEAAAILEDAGWERNEETGIWEDADGTPLAFSLTTADTPELVATAELVAAQWKELGADVTVRVFGNGTISTSVIRPRDYDALLFGEIVGRTLDLFAFWHSTQRNDPGLNLALYTNAKADTLLSDARTETDREEREALYREFEQLVREDAPATFLYAPDFIYVIPTQLNGIELGALTTPAERFLNVHKWHRETESVWHVFSQRL